MKLRDRLLTIFGDLKVFRYPMFVVYDPGSYRVKGRDCREVIDLVQPGDVLVRGYDAYLDGKLIPGLFSHAGLYLGETTEADREHAPEAHRRGIALGKQTVIHAIAEGVRTEDVLDFCRCDRLAILRFPAVLRADPGAAADDPARLAPDERALRDRLVQGGEVRFAEEAFPVVKRAALAQLGRGYDFAFDFKDVRRLSCTELVHRATRALAPFLRVEPEHHRILLLSGTGIVPDAFVSSPLDLVWASPSVKRRALEALRAKARRPAPEVASVAAA
jgi:hypothetical protein